MRIGFLQLRPKFGAVKKNVKRVVTLLSNVCDATIVLPELFNTGYLFRNQEELASMAESVRGGFTVGEMSKIARKRRLNLVFGMAQKYKGKYYNSAVFVSADGKIDVYQKVHLFDREKLFFTRGNSFKVVSTGDAKLGLLICFDWIFPEVSRILTLRGVQVLCHPSNIILPYAQEAMKTRCIENGVYAVTANRIGSERRGTINLTFTGGSQVVGPRGDVLVSAGDRSESLKVIDINVGEANNKNITSNNNILDDRMPSLYSTIVRKSR